jgi:NAD(P)-dependent dehydrogenase (short-subunit alcohol dehydrogenase family)
MRVDFDIKGKVAVITGGAGVLCSEIAKGLASVGVKIAVLDLKEDQAKKVAEDINNTGGTAIAVGVNVLEFESIKKAYDKVLEKFGTVDILINGAGGNKTDATTGEGMSFFDIPEDAMKWVFNLNLLGTIIPTQVFGKIFARKKEGCIINISSMAAFKPLTRTLAYNAAKAGVSNFTQWMATHFNQEYSKNIRVNAIAPGFLMTQQNDYLLVDKETGKPTERGSKILARTPMGRYGKPSELVGAIIFLCSPAASFINGAIIPIDGGYDAYSGV